MKISVLIPTYNSGKTISDTLESVLSQSVRPYEILVMDDGSEDNTIELLEGFGQRISIFKGEHKGVSEARNRLCEQAKGELIAFLDSDDIWHPKYLEASIELSRKYPNAAAICFGHFDFYGYGDYNWKQSHSEAALDLEIIEPLDFFLRYTTNPGEFQTMSGWVVPKSVLNQIGEKPFQNDGAEDAYFRCLVLLFGQVVYCRSPMVAYRVTTSSLSHNKLHVYRAQTKVFQDLKPKYFKNNDPVMKDLFVEASCMTRRQYAKRLLATKQSIEARKQLWISICEGKRFISIIKSIILFCLSFLPSAIQPRWPLPYRS